jgi:hypothetical protein
MRMATNIKKTATRKCPDPQHGSITLSSASASGQPSNQPAAGRQVEIGDWEIGRLGDWDGDASSISSSPNLSISLSSSRTNRK